MGRIREILQKPFFYRIIRVFSAGVKVELDENGVTMHCGVHNIFDDCPMTLSP